MPERTGLIDAERMVTLPALALVFLMLVFPMVPAFSLLKESLFAVILVTVGLVTLKTGRGGLHPTVAVWTFSLSALSFLFVLEGFFAGALGAAPSASVYVIWPVIYGVSLGGIRNDRILSDTIQTFVLSTIFIAIYSQVYLLTQAHFLAGGTILKFLSFGWSPQRFVLGEGYIFMQYPGLNSLPFLVPFCVAALVACLTGTRQALPPRRVWLWIAAFLGVASVPMTGRRALFLVTLTAPLLTLLFTSFQPSGERRLSRKALLRVTGVGVLSVAAALGCLKATYGIDVFSLSKRFVAGFTFRPGTGDKGAAYRREEYYALLSGWTENPVLGAGLGASAYGSIRSPLSPWEYELYYMALLHQTGIVGFGAYAAGICWVYWMGIRVIRSGGYLSGLMVASLVGMSSVLIVSVGDHIYLPRFDGLWTIFVSVALVNFWLMRPARLLVTV